ncbi:MAG: cation:proton antiporter, partial [Gemmatimonadales bacterium]
MNQLAALGLILLLALLAGHVVKFLRIPEVTGYLLAGVLLGPAGGNLITHEGLESLQVFSEVALGLILFAIGSVFEFVRFRRIGRRVAGITAVESLL